MLISMQINYGGQKLLYKHFNCRDHSILSINVRILEKKYHQRKLGTAFTYGCNEWCWKCGESFKFTVYQY